MDDEPTGGINTALSVTVGSSIVGTIEEEGDIDYIAVELQAGTTYQFDLEGQYTAAGTLGDPFLNGIFSDANVQLATSNDDGGIATNSRIVFTPTVSGTYYVSVSHFDNTGQVDTGTYTLFVEEEALSDRPDPITFDPVSDTGNDLIDGITASQSYGADDDNITRVTYSFPDETAIWFDEFNLDTDGPDLTETNIAASEGAVQFLESGLGQISSYANIEFTRVEEQGITVGEIRLSGNTAASGNVLGIAGFPSRFPTGGDIFLFEDNIRSGSLSFVTLHELGHALGLTHTDDGDYPEQFAGAEFTLLGPSFSSAFFDGVSAADLYPTTFGYADILALRHIYGADDTTTATDDVYRFDLGSRYWETLFDTGGTDTILITGSGKSVEIDLTPNSEFFGGSFINVGTTVTYFSSGIQVGTRSNTVFVSPETRIENVTTADGDDVITGNSANNFLRGMAGDDTLDGTSGNDSVGGGTGDDMLLGGDGHDVLYGGAVEALGINDTIDGGSGNDTIFASASDDSIIGGDGDDLLFGGSGNDTIQGGIGADDIYNSAGDDRVDGGLGQDTIRGNAGNDTLTGGNDNDRFVFGANHGDDAITDFDPGTDILHLTNTITDFTDLASVQAASTSATIGGVSGILIDTGGGNSIFLEGLPVLALTEIDFIFD